MSVSSESGGDLGRAIHCLSQITQITQIFLAKKGRALRR